LTPWDQGGFGRDRVVQTGEAVFGERDRAGFSAVSGSEKVVEERESFGSGEVVLFNGLNIRPR